MKILEITKQQRRKIDKINELLTELKSANVYPYAIDRGAGAGLSFIRHPKSDGLEVEEALLGHPDTDEYQEIQEKMYEAPESSSNAIDYIWP